MVDAVADDETKFTAVVVVVQKSVAPQLGASWAFFFFSMFISSIWDLKDSALVFSISCW